MHGLLVGNHPITRPAIKRHARHTLAARRFGFDGQGRFIGPNDVERGLRYFWNAQHRRAQAPLDRPDPVFCRDGNKAPRPLTSGLDFDKLRQIHARHLAGETKLSLARAFGVHSGSIYFHLRGSLSASMRAALAMKAA